MLYVFGGLPATGKTTLSRFLASTINAAYIRIDTIEQALKNTGMLELYDESYRVASALALDNLNNGICVVTDSTNPVQAARAMWANMADQAKVDMTEIEIICSDITEHRNRVENRTSDISNLTLPDWHSVTSREYHPWEPDFVIDTAGKTVQQSREELLQTLQINASL